MHRLDKKIELKKEIFLEFAIAVAKQSEALLGMGNANADISETNERLEGVNRAWHRLCLIASNQTIKATATLNSKWGPAYIEVSRFRMSEPPVSATSLLKFAIEKQCELMPYMAAAYAQMRCELDNPDSDQDFEIEVYKNILNNAGNEMKEYFNVAFPD